MASQKLSSNTENRGFTLVELIVVVTIIGLIASIAIPAYAQSRQNTIVARTANDFRQFSDKFEVHILHTGEWPADGLPTTIPAGMEEELDDGDWGTVNATGGYWDWDFDTFGITAAVSIDNPTIDEETMREIDSLLDDGNLSTGRMRLMNATHLSLVLAE